MRICFFTPHLNDGHFGGAELQVHLYSQEFARRGWKVWMMGEGSASQGEEMRTEGMQYVLLPPRRPGLGFFNYRYMKQALEYIRPDVCYQRVKFDYTYWMLKIAHSIESKSVFAFSHEHECIPGALAGISRDPISRFLAAVADRGIRKADLLLCQTEQQRGMIEKNFAKEATIVKNGHPLPSFKQVLPRQAEIIWVNNLKWWKRPELFFQLASELQNEDATFSMIGAPGRDLLIREVVRAGCSSNLRFYGEQPLTEVNERLWGCRGLVNTSSGEGFSNTFIQAWARVVPVISLAVDPDGVIKAQRLGFHSGDFSRLVSHTRTLIRDPDLAAEMGRNGRSYVEKEHDLAGNARKLDQLLRQLVR